MSDHNETKKIFRPVIATEEKLDGLTGIPGYVYFTSDTHKIFLGEQDGSIKQMSESNSVFYGQKEIEEDNSGNTPNPIVEFSIEEIEGEKLPEVNDLVLNIDGCFYRVTEVLDEFTVTTNRLTLQGTGTGGSGGGGSGEATASLRITAVGSNIKYFSREAKKAVISFIAYSSDAANYVSTVECSYDKDFTTLFATYSTNHPLEVAYEIDITKQVATIESGKKIYVRVTDKYGGTRSLTYTINIVSLSLTTTQNELFSATGDSVSFVCSVGGTRDSSLTRVLHYDLYDESGNIIHSETRSLENNETSNISKSINLSTVAHGAYTLKVYLIGTISGTEVTSNELTHKLLRYRSDVGQPIFTALIPEDIQQYTDFQIGYLLAYGDIAKQYNMNIKINGITKTTQVITAGQLDFYTLNFDSQGTYDLLLDVPDLGVSFSTKLVVAAYTGTLPVINLNRDDLKVYLNPKGRTNNAIDKEYWPDYKNPSMQGRLSGFYFRSVNGWLTDEDGIDYLKLSQGAKLVFDDYSPFSFNPKTENGLTIELDFRLSGVTDFTKPLIQCVSMKQEGDGIKTGFVITGDSYNYYYGGGEEEQVTFNLVEGQRIKLTFVIEPSSAHTYPMCYTYLDGIISNVHAYSVATADFTGSQNYPGELIVDSSNGQIDLYSVRFYNSALNAATVLNNYLASLGTLEERKEAYINNNIRNDKGIIDLDLIKAKESDDTEASSYPLWIPYVKITGGYSSDKSTFTMGSETGNVCKLPTGKKDYRAIDFEIVYPKANPYFKDYEDFKIETKFENENLNVTNGFGKTAIQGAVMYAQGTSSLEYPVKNLRVKFKGAKMRVRPELEPVNLICLKADYMDSSGANNTGCANYVDDVYAAMNIKTPGQEAFGEETQIVTCIKGHPCVVFWSPTGEDGTYEYIGKYNLNLDKATPEPFGFRHDDENKPKFGYLTDENGELVLDKDGNKQNSIYCFEFLDNGVKLCNFKPDAISEENEELTTNAERYRDSWYGTRVNKDQKNAPGWTLGFESRYPEDKEGTNDADVLYPLASWINELWDLKENQGKVEEANQRFADEYQKYFNKDFLLAYYLITEALLMIDSRVKNMMLATWGKEHYSFTNSAGETVSGYDYLWYPIFYDMDTMLGLDNTGRPNKNYYDEDTTEAVYNGDGVLWSFVRDAIPQTVIEYYNAIEEDQSFVKNKILPYFNSNQADMANETFYNGDADYKYVEPYRNGYTDDLNNKKIDPGSGERLYAAQGTRSMQREYFVDNRLNFLRGKYASTQYRNGDRIEFRLTYPKEGSTEVGEEDVTLDTEEVKKMNASIKAVPPSGEFTLTSLKTGYGGVLFGGNGTVQNARFTGTQTKTIKVDTESGNGTECYILGLSNLSDVGDLSDKYLYNLIFGTTENRLKKLKLGNHAKDYYNPYWKASGNLKFTNFTYLEEFDMENCGGFSKVIDLSDSQRIKKINLTGSSVSAISLPVSGVLEELHLPSTITRLKIDSHPTLTAENFTMGTYDYDKDEYVNDFTTNLNGIYIKDTPIDSYAILKAALVDRDTTGLETYCFQDIDWTITDVNDVKIVDGEITDIIVLNKLTGTDYSDGTSPGVKLGPYEGVNSHAEALTGTITIDVGNYTINEYVLYNKYNKIYPNLTLKFVSDNLQAAHWIKFYNSESILGEPYFKGQTDGTATLEEIMDGITQPIKQPDNNYTYSFSGKWVAAAIEGTSEVFKEGTEYPEDGKSFADYVPDTSVSFTPVFDESVRLYTIALYADDKGTYAIWRDSGGTNTCTITRTYGQPLLDALSAVWTGSYNDEGEQVMESSNTILNNYCYRPYDLEDDNPYNQYIFQGWQSEADRGTDTITWPTLESVDVSKYPGDFIAYAKYKIGDIRENPLNPDLFLWTNQMLQVKIPSRFGGKICIPNPPTGYGEVTAVGQIYSSHITEVLFEENAPYTEFINGTFSSCNSLEKITLPEGLTAIGISSFEGCINLAEIALPSGVISIGEKAFQNCNSLEKITGLDNVTSFGIYTFADCSELESIDLPETLEIIPNYMFQGCVKLKLTALPSGVTSIGVHAFNQCHSLGLTALPKSVKTIENYAFYYSKNGVQITEFGGDTNEVDGAVLETIGIDAFNTDGTRRASIKLGNSIQSLSNQAFKDYATSVILPWTEERFLEVSGNLSEGSIFGQNCTITYQEGGTA